MGLAADDTLKSSYTWQDYTTDRGLVFARISDREHFSLGANLNAHADGHAERSISPSDAETLSRTAAQGDITRPAAQVKCTHQRSVLTTRSTERDGSQANAILRPI